ncbi:hypothetical protein HY489_04055 [Candidatus Woesearchaeota archaeon]|nr:hypothetical protein [Candidatus Woesearchaeota archaeon]
MKKSVMAALLLVALLACQIQPSKQAPQPTDFRTGSQGITLQFVQNLPPSRMYDRDPFNVMLQIENVGTSKIGGGGDRVYLSGFDHNIITGIGMDGMPIPILDGRTAFISRGGFDTLNWKGQIRSLTDKRIDKYQPLILATACYNYETIASAQVCIDPQPYAPTNVQKVCTPTTAGTGSQGAPIAVTSVQVEPQPSKTRFIINIQNVGGGNVFRYGTQYINKCSPYSPGLAFDEVDFVQFTDVQISGTSIKPTCKGLDKDGHVRLVNGAGQVFCEVDAQGQTAYLTPLNVIIRYGYRQSIAKPIEIRAVP